MLVITRRPGEDVYIETPLGCLRIVAAIAGTGDKIKLGFEGCRETFAVVRGEIRQQAAEPIQEGVS